MSLFQELKRRNVFRVAVAYIIVAWLLVQVAETLGPALHLPEWLVSGVVFVLILGFPIAVIFAWAFELTPEGIKREREVDRTESITSQTGRKLDFTIIGMLSLVVIFLVIDRFVLHPKHDEVTAEASPSIAVLPFANMSDDAANEYFADGITEEILNLLAKIPELEVTSRNSAFQFKGDNVDIPTVAKQLNVAHVLEGSVRKSGVKVRITAQLIDAETDKHLWSETYDRELNDIFQIQDEIAGEVVDVLHVTLLGEAPKSTKTDPEAYSLYLEGMHLLDQGKPSDWLPAQQRFEAVIDIDSGYAPAWFGRAKAVRSQANFGLIDLDEGTELARQWANHALELDPTLAEAWAMLSHLAYVYDWDWSAARSFAARAREFGPGNSIPLLASARVEMAVGNVEAMVEYAEGAHAVDPLSLNANSDLGLSYWYSRDYEKFEEALLNTADLFSNAYIERDIALLMTFLGRPEDGLPYLEQIKDHDLFYNYGCAFVMHALERLQEAQACKQWVIDNIGIPFGYQIAEMYAWQGETDKAFEWLEISYKNRDGGMGYMVLDPWLDSLHDDPRWRQMLEKMNLLQHWDSYRERYSG